MSKEYNNNENFNSLVEENDADKALQKSLIRKPLAVRCIVGSAWCKSSKANMGKRLQEDDIKLL